MNTSSSRSVIICGSLNKDAAQSHSLQIVLVYKEHLEFRMYILPHRHCAPTLRYTKFIFSPKAAGVEKISIPGPFPSPGGLVQQCCIKLVKTVLLARAF